MLWSQTFEAHSLTPLPRMSLMLTHVAFAGPPSGAKTRVDILYEGARHEMICCSIGTLIRGFKEQLYIRLPFISDKEYIVNVRGESDICLAGYNLLDHHRPASDLYAETQLFGDSSPSSNQMKKSPVKHELVKAMRGTSPVEEDDITPEIVLSGDDTRVVPSAQWTNFLGWQKDHAQRVTSEYEQDDETSPTRSEIGHRRTTSRGHFETEKNPPGSKVKVKTEQVEPTTSSPAKTLAVPIKLETVQPSQTRKKAPTSKPKVDRAESTSSPVKTLAATVKLETPRAQTKAPTSNPPTTIPESPNPKKRAVANADLPESPKRHKKEQAKEGHADAPTHKDEQEGTGLVIQHGDEVDVQYVLSVQNQDGTYTIRREAITLTTVKIGDEAALFGV
ncbi:hypothetical protein PC9H_010218 [Pleurotus ostreatus]|uniref:Nucleoplasmin-like domain-containing protein n=1 Tax=Pleurotus ostreatus TaxID=5322 RepID=A0A8H6ZQJ6_PLEOS|nr:uncharacterized protein PC9H_010218 [Pleurotus ostreatus]KAF7424907.1 hypothetical protein PC9H_010218 [Pleurotus ostreatus]